MITRLSVSLIVMLLVAAVQGSYGQPPPSAPSRQAGPRSRQPKEDRPPCHLSISSLPRFVGVFIGMSYDDVSSIYPEIEKDKHFHKTFDQDGSGIFSIQAENVESPAKEDAIQIDLNIKDRSIYILHLVYPSNKWESVNAGISEISRLIGADESSWKVSHGTGAELKCTDFRFFVNSQGREPGRQNTMSIHPHQPEK